MAAHSQFTISIQLTQADMALLAEYHGYVHQAHHSTPESRHIDVAERRDCLKNRLWDAVWSEYLKQNSQSEMQ